MYQKLLPQGFWRVDGIGRIHKEETLFADVHFSEVKPDHPEGHFVSKYSPFFPEARTKRFISIKYPIQFLQEFHIGSVWKDQKRYSHPPQYDQPLEVDTSQAQIYQKGEKEFDPGLGSKFFCVREIHKKLDHSYYLVAPVLNHKSIDWIIIPCSEIFRFYYGPTSRLLNTLLIRDIGYVDLERSIPSPTEPVLYANKRLTRLEAIVFMRCLSNNTAIKELRRLHQHFVIARRKGATSLERIKASFPFSGTTSLYVSGQPCMWKRQDKNTEKTGFFCMKINQCTRPLDFRDGYLLLPDATPNDQPEKVFGRYIHKKTYRLFNDDNLDYFVQGGPADASLERRTSEIFCHPFSDNVKIHRQYTKANNLRNDDISELGFSRQGKPPLTYEDGNYSNEGKNRLGIDINTSELDGFMNRRLESFWGALNELNVFIKARWGGRLTTRTLEARLDRGELQMTCFPLVFNTLMTWYLTEDIHGKPRPRYVFWGEIQLGNDFFYLAELELRPNENGHRTLFFHTQRKTRIPDKQFHDLLVLTAHNNRWPSHSTKWTGPKKWELDLITQKCLGNLILHRIRHPENLHSNNGINSASPSDNQVSKKWAGYLIEKMASLELSTVG